MWNLRILHLAVAVVLAVTLIPGASAVSEPVPVTEQGVPQAGPSSDDERFGIAFISSLDVLRSNAASLAQRYSWAAQAGANWNRLPFYWPEIEGQDNSFDYSLHDNLVNRDVAQGVRVNAVLMNTPDWATTVARSPLSAGLSAPAPRLGQKPPKVSRPLDLPLAPYPSPATYPPRNLYLSVFSDGTDAPGAGKTINPANYWARFVYNTASRYRGRVGAWEIWNEPDFRPILTPDGEWFGFWNGTVADYARLLKVGYLAVKHADSSATVLSGGLAYWINPNFFGQLLDQIKSDPTAGGNSYYFDASAWHWYSRASQMYDKVVETRNVMSSKGIAGKPIWVNESGIPAWDDPQRPPWGGNNTRYSGSGTMDEQASYVVQALAYGLAANVGKSFYFQHVDDGNAEAFGLLRNNGSARPAFTALRVASQYFESFSSVSKSTQGNVERIIFQGTPKGRVTVLWNKSGSDLTYVAASSGASRAYLVDKLGNISNLNAASPSFSIFLPRATADNDPTSGTDYIVGGSPYLLVEEIDVDNSNLRGYIRDNRGNAVIGAVAASGSTTARVDGNGQFRLAVPPGTASLQASKAGFGTLPPASLSVSSSGVTSYNFNLPPSTNAVANWDFESGIANWSTGGMVTPQVSATAHSGSRSLVLGAGFTSGGDVGGGANSTVEQWITVPTGTQPILSFVYWLQTTDLSPNDKFEVIIARENGQAAYLMPDIAPTSGFAHKWFDLGAWAGARVRLIFNVWQSSPDNPTTAYLDEISVGPAAPDPYRQYFPLAARNGDINQ